MSEPNGIELLAVTLMDLRATTDSMKRTITNAQSSIEQFRHTHAADRLEDIGKCLIQLQAEAASVSGVVPQAEEALRNLQAHT